MAEDHGSRPQEAVPTEQALLPCPFCGGEGEMSYFARHTSPEPAGHFVECTSCAASGPSVEIQGEMPDRVEYTKARAAGEWNVRAFASPPQNPDKS